MLGFFCPKDGSLAMARRPKPVPQMTVAQFDATFPDEDACKAYLQARRWPNGVHCPRCGNDEGLRGQVDARSTGSATACAPSMAIGSR